MGLIHVLTARQDGPEIILEVAFHVPVAKSTDRSNVAAIAAESKVPNLSADEAAAIASGAVLEVIQYPRYSSTTEAQAVRDSLVTMQARLAAKVTATTLPRLAKHAQFAGGVYDGHDWRM